jgi:PEP-CTERM motif
MRAAIGWRASTLAILFSMCLIAATPSSMHAQQIVVSGPSNFVDDYGVNPIGTGTPGAPGFYAGGIYDSVGLQQVSPVSGTTITAQQGSAIYNIPFVGGGAFPTQFYRNLPLDPALTGAWTLTVVNSSESNSPLTADTLALTVSTPPPLVTTAGGVNLSGSLLAPTINWSVPVGSSATTETVYLFHVNPGGPSGGAAFASINLPADTTTYTIPAGVLTAGELYSVSIQSDVRAGGLTGNLEARSRSFTAPFTATAGSLATPIFLPTVSPTLSAYGGPVYDFNVAVSSGQQVAIDPPAATGFIFEIGAGDPNFASVELPNIGNPTPYDLYLWNGSEFVLDTTLNADTVFDFAAGGVSEFEILGISDSLGLNANSATDFVTQLAFTSSGMFTGTMTPVISIPEPSTWAMMLLGFAGLGYIGYRTSRRRVTAAA